MVSSSQKKTPEGLWTTGRMNDTENKKFQEIIKLAIVSVSIGKPYDYEDEQITFSARLHNREVHIFYNWKFPPLEYWNKETKTKEECRKCYPQGINGSAGREIWCSHSRYNFPRCPYGVPTK
jgi:hypothetical protein